MEGAEDMRHLPLQDVGGQPVDVQQTCSLTANNSTNGLPLLQLLRRRQLGDNRRLVVLLTVQLPLLLLRWQKLGIGGGADHGVRGGADHGVGGSTDHGHRLEARLLLLLVLLGRK